MGKARTPQHPYSLFYETLPWSNKVAVVHIMPPRSGLHWCEDDVCWCHPLRFIPDDVFNMPEGIDFWLHQAYTPKGENGNGIR